MSLALYLFARERRDRDAGGDFDGTLDYQERARREARERELELDAETAARDPGDPHELADADDDEFGDRFLDAGADSDPAACSNPRGHSWVYTGTAYGGEDERWQGEGRCYCEHCGADGDA
jgi:hypothetical protein